jgi:hypothetical protein
VLCSLHDFGCWLVGILIKMKVPFFFFPAIMMEDSTSFNHVQFLINKE